MSLNELRILRPGLYLFAQRSHKDAQRGDVAVKSGAPDFTRDEGMREHLARVAAKQAEQFIFDGR